LYNPLPSSINTKQTKQKLLKYYKNFISNNNKKKK